MNDKTIVEPYFRPRRLRENPQLRNMVCETSLSRKQLILPLFVQEGNNIRQEINSMPGQFRFSTDTLTEELKAVHDLGIPAVLLFGIPDDTKKNSEGTAAYAPDGVICRALKQCKKVVPEMLLIADICLCEYTDHGHCGIVRKNARGFNTIHNDETLEILARTAVTYAQAGADVVAPSDMMDGRVGAIRESLDQQQLEYVPILSYAAKYASAFYGPFREAVASTPQFGDRRSHQIDPANSRAALRGVELDLEEGADIVMVKPALPYLDIIFQVRQMTAAPVAAYQVSGEYSALCAAFSQKWLPRRTTIKESLLAIRRAGADLIVTYFAKEVGKSLKNGAF